MNKEVLITIKDEHEIEGETEGFEMTTLGTYEKTDKGYILTYSEKDDFDGCVVTLDVSEGKKVVMTRTGAIGTQLVIEQRERHNCCYETFAGEIMLGVFAKEVSTTVDEQGGTLVMDYTLDFNAGLVSRNRLVITVKNT